MVFLFITFYVLPICFLLSPLLLFWVRFAKRNWVKTILLAVGILGSLVDAAILVRMVQFRMFESANCGGQNFSKLAEDGELHKILQEQGLTLVISTKFCESECQREMESVKDKLNYILVNADNADEEDKYYPIGPPDRTDSINNRRYYRTDKSFFSDSHIVAVSGNDSGNSSLYCEKNYLCVIGHSIKHYSLEIEDMVASFFGSDNESEFCGK